MTSGHGHPRPDAGVSTDGGGRDARYLRAALALIVAFMAVGRRR